MATVITLNRDKLLKKAKRENLWKDEREKLINIRASSIAGTYSMILLIVLIIYNWCTGAPKDSLIGILYIHMGVYNFFNISKEQKILRIASIVMVIAGFIYFIDPLVRRISL
nr:DUF6442 family protein [Clostridium botulinum]